ncbi:hypothetical protein [Nesterenkonia xinjiangensis]|uniref:Uncharacterized protein n=1 Tax=Nesterenkonia xinjiangensis TaxID=225327 RepID=A0A7Z0GKQ2_9MICC|nr:hypothetical protein [Nesterenkonia xinjiangensis]NYJ77727.1 hypothetical protein [Nesterenkonia xinjiangensis]
MDPTARVGVVDDGERLVMVELNHTGARLTPQEVRHRLSEHDAARLGLSGWRRWGLGTAAVSPGQVKFQVGACLFIASAQLIAFLSRATSGPLDGWDRWLSLPGVTVFYVLTLVFYAVYRGNVDDGVYERLAEARRLEAQERVARFTAGQSR